MDGIETDDFSASVERELRATAERFIAGCGIRPALKGFGYLADAVVSYMRTGGSIGNVYADVARHRGAFKKSVENDIDYALAVTPAAVERMNDILGVDAPSKGCKSSFFIAALAKLVAYQSVDFDVKAQA